ncbi:putative ABC transporter, ATP-binding protein [Desulfonema limicola]|uniref:ABC transporter, ATP-binding protein n=1 Tax=Desulfonema limicola TaxID=45656 RepID=A0A975BBE9_9BACT|nr:ABC transporter ATP-binding protein [Desulfonema limicola]QTA82336.1 putative ABC transporter, ATP-binding protein [Desulfonema limicola]
MEILIAENLEKTYRKTGNTALKDFSLNIGKGEIFGLLGPNGAGKTTAISIMSSLIKPDRGKVEVCGIDVFKHPAKARNLFGLVPQDIALYPDLSARENLMYFGRMYGLMGKKLKSRVVESLELTGLEQKADQRISTYSGGMKRRANLAASILHKPCLLFLDEPTVGIDAQSRNMILEKLILLGKQGVSMIYTTHYMEEAQKICTRLGIIDKGGIIVNGEPDRLIAKEPGCRNLGDLFIKLTGRKLRD